MSVYTHEFEVLVEDDNARYFKVTVEATDKQEARKRVRYILDDANSRILRPEDTER